MRRRHDSDRDTVDLARLQDCPCEGWVTPQHDWKCPCCKCGAPGGIEPEYSTTYGDWDEATELTPDVWIIPRYCRGSDYSGSIVERANHKAMLEMCEAAFPDGEGTDYLQYWGGYGTFDLAIRAGALLTRNPDTRTDVEETSDARRVQIVEAMEALDDYPLIDEDLHSEMEMEAQNEAWESWARSDFKRALADYLDSRVESALEHADGEVIPRFRELGCSYDLAFFIRDDWDCPDSFVDRVFWDMAEIANEYWANEQGGDCWIDVEKVVRESLGPLAEYRGRWERDKQAEVQTTILSQIELDYCDAYYLSVARSAGIVT